MGGGDDLDDAPPASSPSSSCKRYVMDIALNSDLAADPRQWPYTQACECIAQRLEAAARRGELGDPGSGDEEVASLSSSDTYFAQLELDVESDLVERFDGDDYSNCMSAVIFAAKLIRLIRTLLLAEGMADGGRGDEGDNRTVSTIDSTQRSGAMLLEGEDEDEIKDVKRRWLKIGRKLREEQSTAAPSSGEDWTAQLLRQWWQVGESLGLSRDYMTPRKSTSSPSGVFD
ncbi:hypothetical protein FOZ63_019354 [Perkinsus olseni]|uniref:Uncharacterized protein n=1 Tax=Perkinsus olseni TaxID=32597 RepID=A0A7J6QKK2_PEROL|nr:hypothetical protein FOZ60_012984 [Perkinsus olseni]KAF4700281.1 hypothetical protein FOZ63_019354 [Perkinsus olseni]KAF4708768.1 hypothetical protein FOZ62_027839 [Perkinsus olseni]